MAHRDPSAIDALSSDRTTYNVSVQALERKGVGGKAPIRGET